MLLHQATRESLGVDLKDNIVVLDEAHNVIDAILEMHSVVLTANQVHIHTPTHTHRSQSNVSRFTSCSLLRRN